MLLKGEFGKFLVWFMCSGDPWDRVQFNPELLLESTTEVYLNRIELKEIIHSDNFRFSTA